MQLFDLLTELELTAAAANAVSPLRLLSIGEYLRLASGQRAIDFGCGRGEMLCLWARCFGVCGVGIDRDAAFIEEARARAAQWGLSEQVMFHCMPALEYDPGSEPVDVAACMGATMAFGGFRPTLRHLKEVIRPGGALAIAEPFYTADDVPQALLEYEGNCHTERALFDMARSEGLEVGYYSRASQDEWDHYVFISRRAEMENFLRLPPGSQRKERRANLHRWQDMYLDYRQKWQGMAFLTLHPAQ